MDLESSLTDKHTEIQQIAQNLYAKEPDWVTFYREILGIRGIVRHSFPTKDMLNDFEQSDAYRRFSKC